MEKVFYSALVVLLACIVTVIVALYVMIWGGADWPWPQVAGTGVLTGLVAFCVAGLTEDEA